MITNGNIYIAIDLRKFHENSAFSWGKDDELVIIMAKNYGKCALCNSTKFLNYAGLCKKCNRSKASVEITEAVMKKKRENLAAQKKREEQLAREQKEMEEQVQETEEEEKDDTTDEREGDEDTSENSDGGDKNE